MLRTSNRIGIDLMGSETPAELLLKAILEISDQVDLTLFGTKEVFSKVPCPPHVTCILVEEVIEMEDDPLSSIRRKKDASMCQGIRMLQRKELDAFVSAGNTGALIAYAKMCLKMLPGIARPALLTLLPTKGKEMAVLDVGATVTFKIDHLLQFASMGIAYQKSRGIENPTLGLLNIGVEAKKGTPELREVYQKLKEKHPTFLGNVEGRDAFSGNIDVLVTDGFTGNVFLKTAEGIAAFILDLLQERGGSLLETLGPRLHYAEYPGAILCGVEGIVVKCHGNASPQAFVNSIKEVTLLIKNSFVKRVMSNSDGKRSFFALS